MKKCSSSLWAGITAIVAGILVILVISNQWSGSKNIRSAITMKHGVALTTVFHDSSPELRITARQQGPFNIGLATVNTIDKHEFTFIGADCIANVKPIANTDCYRIRILIPGNNHCPKEVFGATIDYIPSAKQFAFRPE